MADQSRRSKTSGSGPAIQNGVLIRRRATFFSVPLYRLSLLLQRPGGARFWEWVALALALFALYAGFFTARNLRQLLFYTDVMWLCEAPLYSSPAACARVVFWLIVVEIWRWLAVVVPWAFVAAFVAFVGEEIVLRRRGRA